MFTIKKKEDKHIDEAIELLLQDMIAETEPEKVKELAASVELLSKSKSYKDNDEFSKDTILLVVANLVGIGIILCYERTNVLSSKALNFLMKLK